MNQSTTRITHFRAHRVSALTWNQTLARKMLFKSLAQLQVGCLRIHEADECYHFGQRLEDADIIADLHIHDPRTYADVAFGGSIGAGEAYMSGYWSSPNLTNVMRLFARNITALDALDARQSWLGKILLKCFHRFNRNNKQGSRKNISAHYDLGNDFFSLFLDPTMMYSSAIYPHPTADLKQAATHKLQRICQKLSLTASDHLLEIGTGWGGMAIYAAQHYGCRVTTTTISKEQRDYALEQVRAAGLEGQVTVLFDDYRDLQGRYSKLVSIEMIEAVGHENYAEYFAICSRLLQDDGLMLIQAITIADQRYEQARQSVDFIQRYIFPGGSLPSSTLVCNLLTRVTDMNLIHMEDIGAHYARTLRDWRTGFLARLDEVASQGFDQRFVRMWEFYLCYCEGGFMERSIGTGQYLLAKPQYRQNFCA